MHKPCNIDEPYFLSAPHIPKYRFLKMHGEKPLGANMALFYGQKHHIPFHKSVKYVRAIVTLTTQAILQYNNIAFFLT